MKVFYCKQWWIPKLDESYTKKYQNHFASSYGYELACADNKFRKSFKSHLGKGPVYNFVNTMIKESNCSSIVKKNHFKKEPVMTKEEQRF